ncbi:hypothetical protein PHSY_003519 [Pseudozyma hubeiensis SY62]|uniref:Uncharacterized protein n=1 Tax=Pseudozyma hubeiensis (strain SY62) TaxID=1305764 RepID=R9P3L1_PSEHS|nr:hypothetical protein PHSY_003519 [Pseudozyma hubeiensis SY62]GAC95941.1 hypothetical protein PHSY_003519 [Pseudozyma hubeiensis SY62]
MSLRSTRLAARGRQTWANKPLGRRTLGERSSDECIASQTSSSSDAQARLSTSQAAVNQQPPVPAARATRPRRPPLETTAASLPCIDSTWPNEDPSASSYRILHSAASRTSNKTFLNIIFFTPFLYLAQPFHLDLSSHPIVSRTSSVNLAIFQRLDHNTSVPLNPSLPYSTLPSLPF